MCSNDLLRSLTVLFYYIASSGPINNKQTRFFDRAAGVGGWGGAYAPLPPPPYPLSGVPDFKEVKYETT